MDCEMEQPNRCQEVRVCKLLAVILVVSIRFVEVICIDQQSDLTQSTDPSYISDTMMFRSDHQQQLPTTGIRSYIPTRIHVVNLAKMQELFSKIDQLDEKMHIDGSFKGSSNLSTGTSIKQRTGTTTSRPYYNQIPRPILYEDRNPNLATSTFYR